MTGTIPTANELAAEFCKLMRAQLSADELADVVETNQLETDQSICHSHDYCDANQVMLDALAVFGLDFEPDGCDLINKAWKLATASGFSL